MFRTDARDEQATRNTGIALDAARTGAQAALASNAGDVPDVKLRPGESATIEAEEK
jgi:hypothetical protein